MKAKKTKFISFLGERENKILVHFLGKKETEKPGNQFNKILQIHYYKISWPFEIYFLIMLIYFHITGEFTHFRTRFY